MIHNGKNSKNKILIDERGHQIPYVLEFDDESGEATVALLTSNGRPVMDSGKLVQAKIVLKNAKLQDKE